MIKKPQPLATILTNQAKQTASTKDTLANQWRSIKNRIDIILLSTTALKTEESKRACIAIDSMSADKREEYIIEIWGHMYLERVYPLLEQLKIIEEQSRNL